jgi:4'-phosphopantetheinyl transferase
MNLLAGKSLSMYSPESFSLGNTEAHLGKDEVQAWLLEFEKFCGEEEAWLKRLSSEEKGRAARYHFARDRKQYAVTRACLRLILGNYLSLEPLSLELHYGEHGKPCLPDRYGPMEFNVSHSDGLALLAFSWERMLGVDVERIREDVEVDDIAKRFFSAAEQAALAQLPAQERRHAFFSCWTRKEAFIKARGEGLSLPLHQFDVSVVPGKSATLLATRPVSSEAMEWSLRDLAVPRGYAAALAVRGQDWILKMNSIGGGLDQRAGHS